MFNKTHYINDSTTTKLAFIKSANVQAFPCGRRRSFIEDGEDKWTIPFDPEARLNTEANNRKHSSLNGFTQHYIKSWDNKNKSFILALAGYLFSVKLDGNYTTPANFGSNLVEDAVLGTPNADRIYANIRVEETKLFSDSGLTYTTNVLRNQSGDITTSIDLPIDATDNWQEGDIQNIDNYYFSGLSFSTSPITGAKILDANESIETSTVNGPFSTRTIRSKNNGLSQLEVSLCILEKKDGTWQIHQPALLPELSHGPITDSIKIDTIFVENIQLVTVDDNNEIVPNSNLSVPTLNIVESQPEVYQLQFTLGKQIEI